MIISVGQSHVYKASLVLCFQSCVVRSRYSEHQAAVQETQELVNFRDSSAVCGRKNHCGHRAYITAIADEWGPTT